MQRQPHPGVSVCGLQREFRFSFLEVFPAGREDSCLDQPPPPQPLALQLSLKDSSCCSTGPSLRGPSVPRAHRGATVASLRASSPSPLLHSCGEFQANKFKSRAGLPGGTLRGLSMSLWYCSHTGVGGGGGVLCCMSHPGNKVPAVQLVPYLCVCLHQGYPFRGARRPRLLTGWFTIPWCRGGDMWAEIITVYSFTAALFEGCPVTWRAGHIRHGVYSLHERHLPIIKGHGVMTVSGSNVAYDRALNRKKSASFPFTPPVTAWRSGFHQPEGVRVWVCTSAGEVQHLAPTAPWWHCSGRCKQGNVLSEVEQLLKLQTRSQNWKFV